MEAIVGVISFTALTSVINSISTLSLNIYSLMNNIKVNKNLYSEEISGLLTKTDIHSTIQLLESIISELPEYYLKSTSIMIALHNVRNIIINIEEEITKINNKICYNKNLYVLKNWRSYDFKDDVTNLENLFCILDKRRDNLFKTIEVFKTIPFEDLRKCDLQQLSSSHILALEYKPKKLKSIEIVEIQNVDGTNNIIDEDMCVI